MFFVKYVFYFKCEVDNNYISFVALIQKYAEKCRYFHNFNENYIIFAHNKAKFMPIWNLVFKFI